MLSGEFSHYRVLSRLGQGGMGEVYLAEDLSLRRKTALKFLLETAGDDTGRLVLREARAAAQLDHPFICKVYEVDEHDGRPFIAMEYVEGQSLKERLGPAGLPVTSVLPIATEIAEALHFAHGRGVVHRDLKPANVMIAAEGHVKVMDFGIAKVLGVAAGVDASTLPTVGVAGEPVGTFAYMSPEQVRGEGVDARSDVFAFGIVLQEMITGANPFLRPSIIETANAILHDAAPTLQGRSGIPPALAHVVERCLQKDRGRRYQSLAEAAAELRTVGAGPTAAAPPARSRGRWIAAAVVAGIVAGGAAINWIRPLPFFAPEPVLAFKERDWIVVADFNNLTGDKVFDRSLRLALEVAIAQSQYVNVYPQARVAATLQRMKRWPIERFDETLASEVAARDGIRGVLACDIAQLGSTYSLTARLISPSKRATVLSHSVTADSKDRVLGALDELAGHVRGRLGEATAALAEQSKPLPRATTSSLDALKLYSDALWTSDEANSNEMLRQAVKLDPDFALAHAELGRRYYLSSGRQARERGEQHFVKALALEDRLTLREQLWIQAVAEDSRGRRQQAALAYETYIAQYPEDSHALFRLAWTQMAGLREYAKAIETFKRVVALAPENSSAWVNLATAYANLDDVEHAIPMYEKAFALTPSLRLGAFINHEYGFALVRAGRLADAAATFERMKKMAEPPSMKARGYRSLALLKMYEGKFTAAAEELRQAIVIDQTYEQGVSEFRDRLFLVSALEARGQDREAAAEWSAVTDRISKLSLSPDWLTLPIRMHARRGRIDAARRLLDRALKTTGQSTADASVARNTALDQAYVQAARAEIELAAGHPQRAIELLEPAVLVLKDSGSLESLAFAYARAGRVDQAIERYEEFMRSGRDANESQAAWQASFVELARLYERANRPQDSLRLYRALVERWKDADPDVVLLAAAKKDLARLESSAVR